MPGVSCFDRFRHAAFLLVLGTLVSSVSIAAADQTYPIKLHLRAGDKWAFDSSTSMTQKGQVLANGQVAQPIEQAFAQRRKGMIEVIALDTGLPSAMRITYDRESANTTTAGQQEVPPFSLAGQTVNVSRKDGKITTDLGKDADPATIQEVGHMLDVDTSMYPKEPVALNQEWDGDTTAMAKAYQLQPDDKVTIKCKLLEVHDVDGHKVAEVGLTGTMLKHDQGFIETHIVLDGAMRIDLDSGQATELAMTGKITMQGTQQQAGPDGAPVKISVAANGDIKVHSSVKPVEVGAAVAQGTGFGIGNPPAAIAVPPQNPLGGGGAESGSFTGSYKGDQVALQLTDTAGQVSGTLTVGEKRFPLTGKSDGNKLSGNFESEGTKFDFTASLQGATLTLTSEGNTYTLKKPVANPLARPEAKNPLAQPEPKNPLAQ